MRPLTGRPERTGNEPRFAQAGMPCASSASFIFLFFLVDSSITDPEDLSSVALSAALPSYKKSSNYLYHNVKTVKKRFYSNYKYSCAAQHFQQVEKGNFKHRSKDHCQRSVILFCWLCYQFQSLWHLSWNMQLCISLIFEVIYQVKPILKSEQVKYLTLSSCGHDLLISNVLLPVLFLAGFWLCESLPVFSSHVVHVGECFVSAESIDSFTEDLWPTEVGTISHSTENWHCQCVCVWVCLHVNSLLSSKRGVNDCESEHIYISPL